MTSYLDASHWIRARKAVQMNVHAMLANSAEIREGLLYIEGGGWNHIDCAEFPWTVKGWVAMLIDFDTNDSQPFPDAFLRMTFQMDDGDPAEFWRTSLLSSTERVPLVVDFQSTYAAPGTARYAIWRDDEPLSVVSCEVRSV